LTSKKFKIFALRVLSIQYANTARIEALRLQMPARNRKRMQSLLQIQRNTGTHHASPPHPIWALRGNIMIKNAPHAGKVFLKKNRELYEENCYLLFGKKYAKD